MLKRPLLRSIDRNKGQSQGNIELKKFKEIILHIGPHKTGSSAIQKACDLNRNILQTHSIYYPNGRWHAQFGSCFYTEPENYIFNILSARVDPDRTKKEDEIYLKEFSEELKKTNADKLVISYEGFVDLPENAVKAMQQYLTIFSDKITVLFYCREPLSFACSEISQRLKTGIATSFDVSIDPPILSYIDFADKYSNAFGIENIHARLYARTSMPNGDVVHDFLSSIGLAEHLITPLLLQDGDENSSLSYEAALIAESIAKNKNYSMTGNEFSSRFCASLEKIKGGKIRLSKKQADVLMQAAQPHLDYLAENFSIRIEQDKNYINESQKKIPQATLESIAEVISTLCDPSDNLRTIIKPEIELISATLRNGNYIQHGQLITFDIDFFLAKDVNELEMGIHIFDNKKQWAFGTNSSLLKLVAEPLVRGTYRVSHHVIADLPAGKYTAGFAFAELTATGAQELAWHDVLCEFEVQHSINQPFAGYAYLPTQMTVSPLYTPKKHIFESNNPRLLNQVGVRSDTHISSNSQAGFLMFGPYQALTTGQYQVRIRCENYDFIPAGAWLDVAMDSGRIQLIQCEISNLDSDGFIVIKPILLETPCNDLEVRVWVNEETQLQITQLEIAPDYF